MDGLLVSHQSKYILVEKVNKLKLERDLLNGSMVTHFLVYGTSYAWSRLILICRDVALLALVSKMNEEAKGRLRRNLISSTSNLFQKNLVKKISNSFLLVLQVKALKHAVVSAKRLSLGDFVVERSPVVLRLFSFMRPLYGLQK